MLDGDIAYLNEGPQDNCTLTPMGGASGFGVQFHAIFRPTVQMGLLLNQKLEKADKPMAAKHAELVSLVVASSSHAMPVDERLIKALTSQQAAWALYRHVECELIGSLSGAGGAWPSTWAAQCVANHTELRLRRIRSAIACIQKIPDDKRFFDQNRCLQQLARLTKR